MGFEGWAACWIAGGIWTESMICVVYNVWKVCKIDGLRAEHLHGIARRSMAT